MSSDTPNNSNLSIGAISNSTGIPAATLRTWERRYGFPDPERNEAGHRVYPADIVEHLQMISEALDRGHRASNVVGLSKDELQKLLDVNGHDGDSAPPLNALGSDASAAKQEATKPTTDSDQDWLDEWMDAVDRLDGESLDLYFRNAWNRMGGLDFIRLRAAPFLEELGRRWQMGDLDVAHEHYSSQCLQDFMSTHWRPLSDRNHGPRVICATFSGEQHALGLHFAAIVLAMAGWQIVFLGPSTPHRDILRTADIKGVDAVLISVSSAFNPTMARRELTDLRDVLDDQIDLLVGGGGASRDAIKNVGGAIRFDSLMDFYEWALERIQ